MHMVEGGGFEPPKAEPSDLQSDPFDRSGTPPATEHGILRTVQLIVNLIYATKRAHDALAADPMQPFASAS
jgi:hypothetical protein